MTFVALGVVAALTFLVAAFRRPRATAAAGVLGVAGVFFVLATASSGLSWPRPAHHELSRPAAADILWVRGSQEEGAITMLLEWPGSGGPRLYRFPWSSKVSDQLAAAKRAAAARQGRLMVKRPFGEPLLEEGEPARTGGGTSQVGDVKFYTSPPAALPEK